MRCALPVLAILISSTALAAEPISKKQCSEISEGIGAQGHSIKLIHERLSASSIGKLSQISAGPMKDAAERSEEARQKLLPLLRDYSAAVEDLAYQLRVCAR